MKVLFISNLFPDSREDYRGQDNANLLHRLSAHCEVRALSTRPCLPSFHPRSFVPREKDVGLHPEFIPYYYIPKVGSLFNHLLYFYSTRPTIRRLVSEFFPDVILSSWSFPDSCAISMMTKAWNLPLVSICQGSDVHMYMEFPLRSQVIRANLVNADRIIPRSHKLGKILVDAGFAPAQVKPVYNGVDTSIFCHADKAASKAALKLDPDAVHLLYVGNFFTVKNPSLLVRSLALAQDALPEKTIKLVMIGEGYLEESLKGLVGELGLGESVTFHGRKGPAGVAKFMQASDLLCIPSFNEGLPNVLLEALSCGLPVVSTDVGGIGEVLNDPACGSLVPSHEPSCYAAAIIHQLQMAVDPAYIINFSKRFSWDETVLTYFQILKDAVSVRT